MRFRLNPLSPTGIDIEPEKPAPAPQARRRNEGGLGYVGYTGPKITVSQAAPSGATTGDIWIDTT